MKDESPFLLDRFEYERIHFYHLPKETFDILETQKPTYMIGSRGTGKTTLLKALSWKERLENESLKHALGDNLFEKEYIGVYVRTPLFQMSCFERWLSEKEDDITGPIFGLYLDLIWVELVSEAISQFLVEGILNSPPSEEHQLIKAILDQHPEISKEGTSEQPLTLKGFSRIILQMRRRLERFSTLRGDPDEIIKDFPSGQVGHFGRSVAKLMSEFCDKSSEKNDSHWHFKICMDEAECLSLFQQRVLNTAVRLSEGVAVYVVSYVRLIDDLITTLVPKMSLQKADRQLLILDRMTDQEFRDLCEGVCKVRVQAKLSDWDGEFNTSEILGKLDINLILKDLLSVSESPHAKQLLKKSEELAKTDFFLKAAWTNEVNTASDQTLEITHPIYQMYIIEKLGIELPSPSEERWKKRSQESRELRKKMVAAYLCMCKELKLEVRYAFDQMVLQMSDKCIRDFLSQINEIFKEIDVPLEKFVTTKGISIRKQDAAIKRASKQKKESLPQSGVTAPIEVGRIVDGIARITTHIQTSGPENRALRSSERGIFVIDTREVGWGVPAELLGLIKEAGEAGFLRIVESEGHRWKFRIHCSLAAAYGFSYRGAYYECHLRMSELQKIATTKEKDEFEKLVVSIGRGLAGEAIEELPQQLHLGSAD